MKHRELKLLIEKEIDRLADDHDEKTIYLINKVLRPMILFIEDHDKLVSDIARISGKHIT
jgi:hypothetical protein